MTIDTADPVQLFLITGTGPYGIPWPYGTGAVQATVIMDGALITLDPDQFTLSPASSTTSGNLSLSAEAAAEYAGAELVAARNTTTEQGWAGLASARERGLERQLDQHSMVLQDLKRQLKGAVRSFYATDPFAPEEGRSIMWENGQWVPGFNSAEIMEAEENATEATEAALAAALYGNPQVGRVADLIADTSLTYDSGEAGSVDTGDIVTTNADGFPYRVAGPAAVDHTLITAGGVKVYAEPRQGAIWAEQCGASVFNTAAQNDEAFAKAFAWLNGANRRVLYVGSGSFALSQPIPTIDRSDVAFIGTGRETTRFTMAAASNNGTFLQVGTGASPVARIMVNGFRFDHLNTTGMGLAGYAIVVDDATDAIVENLTCNGMAGLIDVGPTNSVSRLRFSDIRGAWRDNLQHRIGRFQRWTGMLFDDVVVYGSSTNLRTVPTWDFTVVGLCDTLNWNKVTAWTRAGSQYGIFVNCDNGTFVNCWFDEIVLDKTGRNGAAIWIEQTPASTASEDNFWTAYNVYFNTQRSDTGGLPGVPESYSGRSVFIRQNASTGYGMIRNINFTNCLWMMRDQSAFRTQRTGTDVCDDINIVGCNMREAISVGEPNINAAIEMGTNRFKIADCSSGFSEQIEAPGVNSFVNITNADITEFIVTGNMAYNIAGRFSNEPVYTTPSHERVFANNTPMMPSEPRAKVGETWINTRVRGLVPDDAGSAVANSALMGSLIAENGVLFVENGDHYLNGTLTFTGRPIDIRGNDASLTGFSFSGVGGGGHGIMTTGAAVDSFRHNLQGVSIRSRTAATIGAAVFLETTEALGVRASPNLQDMLVYSVGANSFNIGFDIRGFGNPKLERCNANLLNASAACYHFGNSSNGVPTINVKMQGCQGFNAEKAIWLDGDNEGFQCTQGNFIEVLEGLYKDHVGFSSQPWATLDQTHIRARRWCVVTNQGRYVFVQNCILHVAPGTTELVNGYFKLTGPSTGLAGDRNHGFMATGNILRTVGVGGTTYGVQADHAYDAIVKDNQFIGCNVAFDLGANTSGWDGRGNKYYTHAQETDAGKLASTPGTITNAGTNNQFSDGDWTEIASAVSTSGTAVTFTNISQNFSELMVVFDRVSHADASSRYFTAQASYNNGSSWAIATAAITASVAAADQLSGEIARLTNYARTDKPKSLRATGPITNATLAGIINDAAGNRVNALRVQVSGGVAFDNGTIYLMGR